MTHSRDKLKKSKETPVKDQFGKKIGRVLESRYDPDKLEITFIAELDNGMKIHGSMPTLRLTQEA